MSANESAAADANGSAPQFPVVLPGYDQHLVDRRVAELLQQVADERWRADQAEQALAQLRLNIQAGRVDGPEGGVGLEVDVADVLQQAAAAAAGVLAEAGRRIEAMMAATAAKAADRLKVAAQQASSLEQQAQQTVAEAELERTQIATTAIQAAEQVRAQADREARAVVAKAQEDAELAWRNAARQRRLFQAEAEGLATLRQRMVKQLERIYAPLGLIVVDFGDVRDLGKTSRS